MRPGPKLPFELTVPTEFSADGRTLALTGSGADRTTDIYLVTVATGAITRVTESRHDGENFATLVRPELIRYTANDALVLSGRLDRPKGMAGAKAAVFSYHGGLEGQCGGR